MNNNLTIGLQTKASFVEILNWGQTGHQTSQVSLHDLMDHQNETPLHCLIFNETLTLEENDEILESMNQLFPVRPLSSLAGHYPNDYNQGHALYLKMLDQWTLQHNLHLISELAATLRHFKQLWPNDRTSFFEELWYLLKRNLGTTFLKIIYHDLEKSEKEGGKSKLIQIVTEGTLKANTQAGSDLEVKLMALYKNNFHENFEILEWHEDKGELVMSAQIKGSPIFIMAKTASLTPLQKGLIKSLFELL